MAGFNGNGIFTNNFIWVNDSANGIPITASRFDTQDGTIASGLSNCLCKDGQQTATAQIPFAQGITISAGTIGTPSINILSDTDTGFAQVSGAGTMAFGSNGTRAVTFSGTGINAAAVGATTPSTGAFTTLSASSTTVLTGAVTLGGTINKLTLTAPATGSTITIVDGKTLKVDNTLEFAGTDSTKMTFPGTTDTVVTLAATQVLTNKTLTTAVLGSSTATTQSLNDSSTKIATTAFVNPSSTLATLGSRTNPDGSIDKWNAGVSASSSGTAISFAVAFPNSCFNVMVTKESGSATPIVSSRTASGFTVTLSAGGPDNISWRAIGN